ncbi:omptin family outer membrane protease [Afifella pfennigii]|uniref:omptin family outer membrane protease n=1 Tax=Afifella pfennigii TaxID=209897 RepID=UPI00047EDD6F|nr:omptin family outer membrane protease [Afifella pfennigii]
MQATNTLKRLVLWLGAAGGAGLILAADTEAADLFEPYVTLAASETSGLNRETSGALGMRYWYSTGETAKDLFAYGGGGPVSRLTYDGLNAHSVELFGQVTHNRLFAKGLAGAGWVLKGSLRDEDFPPYINPYSSTDSDQEDGNLYYASVDAGGYVWQQQNFRFGAFAGYSFFRQNVHAFGCVQEATSTICAPALPASTKVISQENDWHGVRLGVTAEAELGGRWLFSGEAAFLPYAWLDGADSHHLRICTTPGCFNGDIEEDGSGWGYQLEAGIAYRVSESFRIGLGGRYWHMQTSGKTHFENAIVGFAARPQPVDWEVDIYGITAEAAFTF